MGLVKVLSNEITSSLFNRWSLDTIKKYFFLNSSKESITWCNKEKRRCWENVEYEKRRDYPFAREIDAPKNAFVIFMFRRVMFTTNEF